MNGALRLDPRRTAPPPPEAAGQLDAFLTAQRTAYACAEAVAKTLNAGDSERDAAARMEAWLHARGVTEWFHRPFAWFGERAALRFRLPHAFFPTGARLEPGMAYILDVAPVVDGHPADIGYAQSLGQNPELDALRALLRGYRAVILDMVNDGHTLRDIYLELDALLEKDGCENRHRAYPARVLGHRVRPLHAPSRGATFAGFGVNSLFALGRDALAARLGAETPLWNASKACDVRPLPGLWAVEPHIARGNVAAKFEELLVVTEHGAHWLDDDVPHMR